MVHAKVDGSIINVIISELVSFILVGFVKFENFISLNFILYASVIDKEAVATVIKNLLDVKMFFTLSNIKNLYSFRRNESTKKKHKIIICL